LYLLWYGFWKAFVVDLQVISDSPILLQAARLQATERNGGGRSDVNQMLEESCEKAGSCISLCALYRLSLVGNAVFGWCGLHEEEKGFTVLAKYCCKADVN
jgi:hypothetical protein